MKGHKYLKTMTVPLTFDQVKQASNITAFQLSNNEKRLKTKQFYSHSFIYLDLAVVTERGMLFML